MSNYDVGYQHGKEEYSQHRQEASTWFQPGTEGYKGFADGYCEKIEEEFQEYKYRHENDLGFM